MKLAPYPKYKDSGVEWLGEIPEEWEVKRLKNCDLVIMGQSPNSEDYNTTLVGLPFLQGNADFTEFHPTPRIWCDTANKLAEEGNILLSVRAPIGAVNIADQKYGIGRGLCAIQAMNTFQKYLYYVALCLHDELNSIGTGSTYTAVSVDEIKNVVIPQPPFYKQQAIANFLDQKTAKIDELIKKNKKLVELLKEKRQAIISHAATKGLDPNVEMKDSGVEWIGKVPEHWDVHPVKYRYDVQLGKMLQNTALSSSNQLVPYLKALHVQWGKVTIDDLPEMWAGTGELSQYGVKDGDLLVCEGGEAGRTGIVHNPPKDCIIQNALHRVRVKGKESLITYLLYVMYAVNNAEWFSILCNKATIAHFTREKFVDLKIPIPPRHEQEKIVNLLDRKTIQIDAQTEKITKIIDCLKEYRQSLISNVVTGKLDVRGEQR